MVGIGLARAVSIGSSRLAQVVNTAPAATNPLDAWMADQPKGTVSGTLKDKGVSVAGGVVLLINCANPQYVRDTLSDAGGNYQFSGVPAGAAGEYLLVASYSPGAGRTRLVASARITPTL
jgi:hypothetical protein